VETPTAPERIGRGKYDHSFGRRPEPTNDPDYRASSTIRHALRFIQSGGKRGFRLVSTASSITMFGVAGGRAPRLWAHGPRPSSYPVSISGAWRDKHPRAHRTSPVSSNRKPSDGADRMGLVIKSTISPKWNQTRLRDPPRQECVARGSASSTQFRQAPALASGVPLPARPAVAGPPSPNEIAVGVEKRSMGETILADKGRGSSPSGGYNGTPR